MSDRPRLGVFKFTSCDGCQVSILNLDEQLLELFQRFDIVVFAEASSRLEEGPLDVALIEGSISTEEEIQRIHQIRERAAQLITIGACAAAGGIQALRNSADVTQWRDQLYPHPEGIDALDRSTPISEHVPVDYEIRGCPVDSMEVLRVLSRALLGATPDLSGASVCLECKRQGNVCVLVARQIPCMGPVTRSGCGAICPTLGRDCYACFGPSHDPNVEALASRFLALGLRRRSVARRFRGVAGDEPAFRRIADRLESRHE
jgi:coenzyme F420-reducing hydrogenase gamma subunit